MQLSAKFHPTIFDDNGNWVISNCKFVAVMKNKLKRGLEKPEEIGIVNLLAAITKCTKTTPISARFPIAKL
jgi:hypothetical protein